jgi:hypothetical protein
VHMTIFVIFNQLIFGIENYIKIRSIHINLRDPFHFRSDPVGLILDIL